MIDDTTEEKRKAKENAIAGDGKIIYKPMEANIVEPITGNILKPITGNIVEPITGNILKPMIRNIVYPVGAKVPETKQKKEENATIKQPKKEITNDMDSAFASINDANDQGEIENITVGTNAEFKESTSKTKALNLEIKK